VQWRPGLCCTPLRKHAKVTEGGSYQIPRRVFDAILAGELSPPKPQRRG